MNVLVVAPTLPHPRARHAGGLYLLDHLEALAARGVHVTLLCIDTSATPTEIESVPPSFELVLADPSPQPLGWAARLRAGARARLRTSALDAHAVASLLAAGLVERARAADLVELQWPELGVLLPLLRARGVDRPLVIVEHDVAAEAAPSRIDLGTSRRARLMHLLLHRLRLRTERRDLDAADLILVFKEPDVELLRRLGVRTQVEVVQPRLDAPPATSVDRSSREVLFTGAMWRPENERAMQWLLARVWPLVRDAVPDAALTIAGSGPSPRLHAIADGAGGVTVTGDVPDLAPFYRRATVFVAPLWTAGGLKFKVLQAMAHGLPVVASTVAAAGIARDAFWAVTDDAERMADAIIDALRTPADAAAAGARAAGWVASAYSFERSIDGIVARYRALAGLGGP